MDLVVVYIHKTF